MVRRKIMVVDDDRTHLELVSEALLSDGYEVVAYGTGDGAVEQVLRRAPDLLILDVVLPGEDGIDICRAVRARSPVPILMLSARGEEMDKVLGLRTGADDYLSKPFGMRELLARVKALLRRAEPASDGNARASGKSAAHAAIQAGEIEINAAAHTVSVRGQQVGLSPKEFELLWFLAEHPRQVFSHDTLYQRIWDPSPYGDISTVAVHMKRLRDKIEVDPVHPRYLHTVRGVGYKLEVDG